MSKRTLAFGLAVTMLLVFAGTSFAAGKLTVSQETFVVMPYTTYFQGVVYAELTNSGDKPVELSGGLLELYDKDGNSIQSAEVYSSYPEVLQPGEKAYVNVNQYVEEATTKDFIADYSLTISGKGAVRKTVTRFPATARYERVMDDYWTNDYIIATVENNTDATVYGIEVGFALKDAEGKLIYVYSVSYYDLGVMPHTSVEMRTSIYSDTVTFFTENNIIPASAECVAYTTDY